MKTKTLRHQQHGSVGYDRVSRKLAIDAAISASKRAALDRISPQHGPPGPQGAFHRKGRDCASMKRFAGCLHKTCYIVIGKYLADEEKRS